MSPDETLHQYSHPPLSRREIELEIVSLLDEACVRLKACECQSHHDLLAGFRDPIRGGNAVQLEELERWVAPCAVFDTAEDGYVWHESDLASQLAQAAGKDFIVSAWGKQLVKLIAAHKATDK